MKSATKADKIRLSWHLKRFKKLIGVLHKIFSEDNRNYVEPDISVICDKNKLTDKGCNGAPDWIIEVVSRGSQRMDCMIKLFKYRTAGVKEYWIVDPLKKLVTVYDFEQDGFGEYRMSEVVKGNVFQELEIDFSEI